MKKASFMKRQSSINAMSFIASILLKFIYLTCRKTDVTCPKSASFFIGETQGVLCFWHARLIMISFRKPKNRKTHVLISNHADGEWIAKVSVYLGIKSVRGSSSNGAVAAMRDMMKIAKSGDDLAITPDGPRGPRHEAAAGAIWAAKATGLPLIPISYSCTRAKVLNSWDRFIIPLPFGRIHYAKGEPIYVPRDADEATLEALRKTLQDALISLTNDCDRECGLKIT